MIYKDISSGGQGTSFASHHADVSLPAVTLTRVNRAALIRAAAQLAVVASLVVLAVLNISVKGWTEVEDGALWVLNGNDVVASVVAEGTPAADAGLKAGDVLLKVGDRDIHSPRDVVSVLHGTGAGAVLQYVVVRNGTPGSAPDLI